MLEVSSNQRTPLGILWNTYMTVHKTVRRISRWDFARIVIISKILIKEFLLLQQHACLHATSVDMNGNFWTVVYLAFGDTSVSL